ncbi:RelA/SpoT domain-containing protein [Stenotrophomonas maltophilia]|nr:RelA/SpoT domain-containing protein [Stenotrophomonas maltophilia]EKT4079172.1 RelA/SpoT domain-containing protein [Stenotrophomonas maltophilia]
MAFVTPQFSRKQVERAGDVLRQEPPVGKDIVAAMPVISNWRAAHAYPLNTFQAALRKKLKAQGLDAANAAVGQRLKRLPSIASKLQRFGDMSLSRMQDIAGLRAVVPNPKALDALHRSYVHSARFPHELRKVDNYVAAPKADGYRSIHLVYRYQNARAPAYDGLHVELQLRTRLQHAWATAVETVDVFENLAIKAGRPTPLWREFFLLASSAFAVQEKTAVPDELKDFAFSEIVQRLQDVERRLNVLALLRGFSVAADKIHQSGRSSSAYHLVILNTERSVLTIKSFAERDLEEATAAYAEAEARTANGEPIDAVLVAGGGVDQLRKTYPNYFLDAGVFVQRITALCRMNVGAQ